jgi:hypothetical protein
MDPLPLYRTRKVASKKVYRRAQDRLAFTLGKRGDVD